jgi:CPA2 family monovalent cation:H+ antiporter-2
MHELTPLRDLVILVAVAIPIVAVANRLRIPSIVGFLVAGLVIGPHALRLVQEVESVSALAEIGLVLLLFAIGLELSLARIIRMGRELIEGGLLQVVGTMLAVAGLAAALAVPLDRAVFYGALAALSSTAVVLKVYTERAALDSPYGTLAVAILLFQDLMVVPLVLLVRLLGGADATLGVMVREVGAALLVVGGLLVVGRWIIPWVLERIVSLRNRELFTLFIMFFGLGAAYLTAMFGLSLAIGAFIAGLIVSESEYGVQALSDVLPFRDTFTGIFFTSVGMLLDIGYVMDHPLVVIGAALGILVLKATVATGAALALKRTLQVSIVTGLGLAQVGEFSFVLATVAEPFDLLGPDAYQVFLGASVLTMLAAPFVISAAPFVADRICRMVGVSARELPVRGEEDAEELADHVVIVGYGVNGRNLARVLDGAGIAYIILEQNGRVVQRAREQLQPILFGDATQVEILKRVGIERARIIVFAISSPQDEYRGVRIARQLNPNVRIVVRTRYLRAMPELQAAGADEVIPEEFETSLEIFARVLRHYEIPSNVIEREVQAARAEQYGVLLGRERAELQLDALAHLGVHRAIDLVEVEEGSRALGEHPRTLDLRQATGATVIAVVRDGKAHYTPDPEFRFQASDTVVLVGDEEALERAGRVFRTTDATVDG